MTQPNHTHADAPETNRGGNPRVRWWLTITALLSTAFLVLAFGVCVRTTQQALPRPDGSIVWHQEAFYGLATYTSDHGPLPPPAPAELPAVEWVGIGKGYPQVAGPRFVNRKTTQSGTPLVLILVLIPPVSTGFAIRLWWNRWRAVRRSRAGRCTRCGYDTAGLTSPTCPECGSHLGPDPEPSMPAPRKVGGLPDVLLTLACATFGLSLFFIACEFSFRIWINWLILWPALTVLCVPAFAWFALERPRTIAAVTLAAAIAWMAMSHTEVYAYLLVHWVRPPGIPGSKGLEPETIKPLFRYGGGVLLLLTAALTATTGGRNAAR